MTKADKRALAYAKSHAYLGNDYYQIYDAVKYGYLQAEKDLTPAFEFPFDVPDNDGHIVFTRMDNMTIRKELKLKKGERVIISIRKEK